ncbi:acid phosphatase (class A) [Rhizobiales bacterium GAS191]|jgi:acid phosphatase (class A)|nr:acid phosphatase (class A) [Rhizobiales bacterium GAS188]SED14598.1 acid phosphatase (class A) [Rhizobiales bacterium GAS191]
MMKRAALFAAMLFLVSPGLAGEQPYVTAADLDLTAFLPRPVQAGSDADKVQLAHVLAVQKAASPDQIALAQADAEESVFDMYSRMFGPPFNPQALPQTTHLFARVGASEDATVDPAKPFFGRVRPFLANTDIQALVKPSKSGAYPSGHSTRVTAVAIILTSMLPEKRDAIWMRASEYMQGRVVGGMHYQEDLDAGSRTGSALAAAIMANPDFKADYPLVRQELRTALGLE